MDQAHRNLVNGSGLSILLGWIATRAQYANADANVRSADPVDFDSWWAALPINCASAIPEAAGSTGRKDPETGRHGGALALERRFERCRVEELHPIYRR